MKKNLDKMKRFDRFMDGQGLNYIRGFNFSKRRFFQWDY
jgi:hypothetical protein